MIRKESSESATSSSIESRTLASIPLYGILWPKTKMFIPSGSSSSSKATCKKAGSQSVLGSSSLKNASSVALLLAVVLLVNNVNLSTANPRQVRHRYSKPLEHPPQTGKIASIASPSDESSNLSRGE